jgi:hypothetical protein
MFDAALNYIEIPLKNSENEWTWLQNEDYKELENEREKRWLG